MIYNKFKYLSISQLAMGSMRLPRLSNDDGDVDIDQTKKMVALAHASGINYYDTAYGYHNKKSEVIMGDVLKEYPRESFYLASKFPGYDPNNWAHVEEIFEEQLEKCQVEYFDFYLVHNVCEMDIDAYLDEEQYGIIPYLIAQKEAGRIKHLGFSVHAQNDVFDRYLNAYGAVMEFCQIQLNYIDWNFQKADYKVKRLNELGIPIWVMEPLRGGRLTTIPEELMAPLEQLRPGVSAVEWAYRFLQSIPGIVTILSGASSLEQMQQNLCFFETNEPLNATEMETLLDIAKKLTDNSIPCTACNYCAGYCPMHLNISMLVAFYNQRLFTGKDDFMSTMGVNALPEDKRPSACIGCRSCETVCPQQIAIADVMSDFVESLKG